MELVHVKRGADIHLLKSYDELKDEDEILFENNCCKFILVLPKKNMKVRHGNPKTTEEIIANIFHKSYLLEKGTYQNGKTPKEEAKEVKPTKEVKEVKEPVKESIKEEIKEVKPTKEVKSTKEVKPTKEVKKLICQNCNKIIKKPRQKTQKYCSVKCAKATQYKKKKARRGKKKNV